MSWSWNKYRENHADQERDRELREKFPNWEQQLEERTRNLEEDLKTSRAQATEKYPWTGAPDSD